LRGSSNDKPDGFEKESFGTISSQQIYNIRSQILVYKQLMHGILPKAENLECMTDANSWKNRRNSHIHRIGILLPDV